MRTNTTDRVNKTYVQLQRLWSFLKYIYIYVCMSKNDEIKINIIKGKKKREKEKVIIKKKKTNTILIDRVNGEEKKGWKVVGMWDFKIDSGLLLGCVYIYQRHWICDLDKNERDERQAIKKVFESKCNFR